MILQNENSSQSLRRTITATGSLVNSLTQRDLRRGHHPHRADGGVCLTQWVPRSVPRGTVREFFWGNDSFSGRMIRQLPGCCSIFFWKWLLLYWPFVHQNTHVMINYLLRFVFFLDGYSFILGPSSREGFPPRNWWNRHQDDMRGVPTSCFFPRHSLHRKWTPMGSETLTSDARFSDDTATVETVRRRFGPDRLSPIKPIVPLSFYPYFFTCIFIFVHIYFAIDGWSEFSLQTECRNNEEGTISFLLKPIVKDPSMCFLQPGHILSPWPHPKMSSVVCSPFCLRQ